MKNNLKIAFVPSTFLPIVGGAEIQTHNLANSISRKGHSIDIWNTKEGFYCNICGYPYINKDDFASKLNHHCCYDCYLTFAESRKDLWKKGWRPKQEVIDNYSTTIYVEEALYRLVEIHYKLGLKEEAKKYASLLGYNYQSSEWYLKSYKIFNKDYVEKSFEKKKKNKKSTLEKIKSLLDLK